MPSMKKRINLTVPNEVYLRIADVRKRRLFFSDASTIMFLVALGLNVEKSDAMK